MALYDTREKQMSYADLDKGRYFTDGKHLFRIVDSEGAHRLLENARHPDEKPFWEKADTLMKPPNRPVYPRS